MQYTRQLNRIAVSGITAVLISACTSTPSNQISDYGTAVENLTTQIDAVIQETNQVAIEYQLQTINNYALKSAKQERLEGRCEFVLSSIDSQTANTDNQGNQCTSVGKKTLKDIAPVYQEAEFNDSLDIVSTAVVAIGRTIVESKRNKAIKQIVTQADPWIQKLTAQMAAELKKQRSDNLVTSINDTILRYKITRFNDLARANKLKPEKSRKMLDEIYADWTTYSTRKMKSETLVKAVQGIGKSHKTLLKEVEKDVFSSSEISHTVSQLTDFYKQLDSTKELLSSCTTELVLEGDAYVCKSDG
ncbi:hypothetical protein [Vibrio sp. M260118]|uniref:hypothetical protein n=1 Tax=Vibrio sp. M260118 TaxID=3020896 RepID=UPI002F4034B1